jgi:hypothetical protein
MSNWSPMLADRPAIASGTHVRHGRGVDRGVGTRARSTFQPTWTIWLSRSQTCTNNALDNAPRECFLALRKRQSKMDIAHFAPDPGIAVDPDDVRSMTAIGPWAWTARQCQRLYTEDNPEGLPADAVDKIRKMMAFLQNMEEADESARMEDI